MSERYLVLYSNTFIIEITTHLNDTRDCCEESWWFGEQCGLLKWYDWCYLHPVESNISGTAEEQEEAKKETEEINESSGPLTQLTRSLCFSSKDSLNISVVFSTHWAQCCSHTGGWKVSTTHSPYLRGTHIPAGKTGCQQIASLRVSTYLLCTRHSSRHGRHSSKREGPSSHRAYLLVGEDQRHTSKQITLDSVYYEEKKVKSRTENDLKEGGSILERGPGRLEWGDSSL